MNFLILVCANHVGNPINQVDGRTLQSEIFKELDSVVAAVLDYYKEFGTGLPKESTGDQAGEDAELSPEWALLENLFRTTGLDPSMLATSDELIWREKEQRMNAEAGHESWECQLRVATLISNRFVY